MPIFRRGDPKYFDCGFATSVIAAGTTWADTEVTCDNLVSADGTTTAYTASCLLPTVSGSGYGQVEGTSYLLNKIRVRGRIQRTLPVSDSADVVAPLTVRALLVMDTMPNGVQAQGEDVIQDFGEATENLFAFQRVASTAGKFRVLKDETWSLPVVAAATDGTNTSSQNVGQAMFNWKWQPKVPLKVNVKAGTSVAGVAGTINCNIFMLVYATQQGAIVSVAVIGCSRAYYTE